MDEELRESEMERSLREFAGGLGELKGELRAMRDTINRTWQKVDVMSLHESAIAELTQDVKSLSEKIDKHIDEDKPFGVTLGEWCTRIVAATSLGIAMYLLHRLPQIIDVLGR
ncbi:hypothetical protein FACS1894187_04880 [Synergistales bacterium]|nr:hypothetical protein FACS1894187_04880 [Synergistales bacterium]